MLYERLKRNLRNIIGPYQFGFQPGKSTIDQKSEIKEDGKKMLSGKFLRL